MFKCPAGRRNKLLPATVRLVICFTSCAAGFDVVRNVDCEKEQVCVNDGGCLLMCDVMA